MPPPKSKPVVDAAPVETVVVDPSLTAGRASVIDAIDWESKVRELATKLENAQDDLQASAQRVKDLEAKLAERSKHMGKAGETLRCVHCGNIDLEPVDPSAPATAA